MDLRCVQWLLGKLRFRWRHLVSSQQEQCILLGKVVWYPALHRGPEALHPRPRPAFPVVHPSGPGRCRAQAGSGPLLTWLGLVRVGTVIQVGDQNRKELGRAGAGSHGQSSVLQDTREPAGSALLLPEITVGL